tara:strand:- start:177 stop:755 length:579 start_codon:yes stop_codon:yes gene_type:complete
MATREELVSIFGEDFEEILQEMATLSPEIELMITSVVEVALFEVEGFANNISKRVATLQAQGISQQAITQSLVTDMQTGGVIFGAFRNKVKENIVKGINESGRIGQYEEYVDAGYTEDSLWRWVTVSGHRICPDCIENSGKVKTYKEWTELGLPASSANICGGYCYCILDVVGNFDDEVPVAADSNVREKRS